MVKNKTLPTVLIILGVVGLAALFIAKPKTPLPKYTLLVTGKPENMRIQAKPETDVPGELLQAEAFYVDDRGVHAIAKPATIDSRGNAHVEGSEAELFPSAKQKIILGIVVGRKDSMPSASEAWEELVSEGVPRPAFRILSQPLVITSTRGRSAGTDQSDRPSP
jgi:hypothetical protein